MPLFRITQFFTKVYAVTSHSEVEKPRREWRTYLARPEKDYPDFIIFDEQGCVNPTRLDLCLEPVTDGKKINMILLALPEDLRLKIHRIAEEWGWRPRSKEDPLTPDKLADLKIIVRPVPRLKDLEFLKTIDWTALIDELVAFKTKEKDPVLKLVHRAHLLKGMYVAINPHAIEATNGGTGKTTFYENAGINIGKATAKAFLGFARSPTEIFPGTVDGTDDPTGLDQMESHSAGEIMRHMFNILERGFDTVSAGAIKFKINSLSTFALLSNPIGDKVDSTKSFATLMYHISANPAFGRRIGIIVYGTEFKKIKQKQNPSDLEAWQDKFKVFRAVEEYSYQKLLDLIRSEQVWSWVNLPIPSYEDQIMTLLKDQTDDTVLSFLEEHATSAQARVRGAALYAALADHLTDVALDQLDMDKFLETCNDYLGEFVEINLESIARICKEWAKEQSVHTKLWFENLPDYAREIVSAGELYRRTNPSEATIPLSALQYEPSNPSYRTLNECLRKLAARKKSNELLEKIKRHAYLDIVQVIGGWRLMLLRPEPVSEITPVGTLLAQKILDQIDVFDNSTADPDKRRATSASLETPSNGRNGRTGRNLQEASREIMRKIVETLEIEKEKALTASTIAYHIGMLDEAGSVETVERLLEQMQKEDLVEKDSKGLWRRHSVNERDKIAEPIPASHRDVVNVDERFENPKLLHPNVKRGSQTPTEREPDDDPLPASESRQAIRFVCACDDGECDYATTIRGEAELHEHGTVLVNLSPKLAGPSEAGNLGDADVQDEENASDSEGSNNRNPVVTKNALRLDPTLIQEYILKTIVPQEMQGVGYAIEPKIVYGIRQRFGDAAVPLVPWLLTDFVKSRKLEEKPRKGCWRLVK